MIDPPYWNEDRLEEDRQESIALFRRQRLDEPGELYAVEVDEHRTVVAALLAQTADLRDLEDDVMPGILADPKYRDAFRYFAGPPISEDDWMTLAQTGSLAPNRLRREPETAARLAQVVLNAIDQRRFPWLTEGRDPTPAERDAAVLASACLWAHQRTQTARRSSGKKRLEGWVEQCLLDSGFRIEPRRNVELLRDAPQTGGFCREASVAGRRADFVVGLWDGRHLLIECKDSNSYVNSVKRLNNDTAAKATFWLRKFGEQAVVPVAAISGVFHLNSLVEAQRAHLALFWGHQIGEFRHWLNQVRNSAT
jgi:hypothetical protein